ncbi:MAG: ABC transporter substrate-binding protein [Bacteriovoracaceae bacterium]
MYLRKSKIALLLVSIGISVAAYGYFSKEDKEMKLRVAFPYNQPVESYEPTAIHFAPEYIFLENVYSPLIEVSNANGNPVAGVAEKFQWDEETNEFFLHIRKGLRTIDGRKITAYDAEFSLKRLLIIASNTHGNFKDLICPKSEIKTIESNCDGIEVRDEYTLVLKPGEKKAFLANIITAIDFAIIPISSVDPKTLKIIDYRNTSGPYYVDSRDADGKITLKVNPSHYHYSPDLAQEIEIIPSGIDGLPSAIDLYKEGKVDHITTIDKLGPGKIINFSKEVKDASLHTTMDIRTFAIFFTERGLKELSAEERLAYGKAIKASLAEYFMSQPGFQDRKHFLPSFGDGHLSKDQASILDRKLEGIPSKTKAENFRLSLLRVGSAEDYKKYLSKDLPGIDVFEGTKIPTLASSKLEEMPHAFLAGPDVTFNEDISFVSYSINVGLFGMTKEERQEWLKTYMSILDKAERLELLKKLHFDSLMDGVIYPLASSPYIALLRKPWVSHLPQLFANNPLWTIKKK